MKRDCIIIITLPPYADEEERPAPQFFYGGRLPPSPGRDTLDSRAQRARHMTAKAACKKAHALSLELPEASFTVHRDRGGPHHAELLTCCRHCVII